MRILIRHRLQDRYLNRQDQWVADVEMAHDFMQGDVAIDHAAALGLTDIELHYRFPNPKYDFSTPLDALGRPGPGMEAGT
jgi:hypothetical protein